MFSRSRARGLVLSALAGLLCYAVALAAAVARPAVPAQAAGTPLRQVDWAAVLAGEPAISLLDPGQCLPPPVSVALSCVDVPLDQPLVVDGRGSPGGESDITGYIAYDDIQYGDLDGDDLEEAALPIESGGTAGSLGFLVYRQASPRPRLLAIYSGYKVGTSIRGGLLEVAEPFYFGFEPNCCPTALWRTPYTLDGDELVPYSQPGLYLLTRDGDVPTLPSVATVVAYYRALDARQFGFAYSLLTPAARALMPYDSWRAGFFDTQSIAVEASAAGTPVDVNVAITATDAGPEGMLVTRVFTGTWMLAPLDGAPLGLGLDTASIQAAAPGG